MVTSPTGKGVIVMGGSTAPGEHSKAIFELSASMQWTRLEQSLQIDHWAPLAIPIPDEKIELEDKEPEDRPSMRNYIVDIFVKFFNLCLTHFLQ